jgi:hypothetical protein
MQVRRNAGVAIEAALDSTPVKGGLTGPPNDMADVCAWHKPPKP